MSQMSSKEYSKNTPPFLCSCDVICNEPVFCWVINENIFFIVLGDAAGYMRNCSKVLIKKNKKWKKNERLIIGYLRLRILIWFTIFFNCRHPKMRARIELLLKQNKLTKEDVKDILQVLGMFYLYPVSVVKDKFLKSSIDLWLLWNVGVSW